MIVALAIACAMGAGIIAGTFFAFSTFIMAALHRLRHREGIAAMQMINVTVINPLTMGVFIGTALLCVVLAGLALMTTEGTQRTLLVAGSALYVIGCFLVTGTRNVPLNNQLESVTPQSSESHPIWKDYLKRWTLWNHVRTVASALASVCLIVAIIS